jgi:arabinofuranan 3-O-arabinosyltransferase
VPGFVEGSDRPADEPVTLLTGRAGHRRGDEPSEGLSTDPTDRSGPPPRGLRARLRRPSWPALVLALISYVPLLLSGRGFVGADTKQYLYLNPSQLLARAPYLWDKHIGAGSVTHQNIGYLFPQGPWYWVFQQIGAPDWVAQRLWSATLLFAAGCGVLALVRSFGWRDRAAFLAAAGYMLSPYVLEYESRISAILLPWAGLPWMVALAARGLRAQAARSAARAEVRASGGDRAARRERLREVSRAVGSRWRHPALFALVVALVGGTNATSLLYAGLAPVLWLPFALAHREITWRGAAAFAGRTAALTLGVSLWWITGLMSQAGYGLDVLAYSETVKTVASGSQATEVLRGLGNWYFYGRDGVGPWVEPSVSYTQNLVLIAVSFALPILALLAAVCLRWRHKGYFVTLILVGTAVAVGVYPYAHPSAAGGLFKAFAEGSTAGLALRSTPRAVPLVTLGFSVLLAGAVDALAQRWSARGIGDGRLARFAARRPWVPAAAYALVLLLVLVNMLPLWRGQFVEKGLERPENLPSYVTSAAKSLNAAGESTRVLELPGADFSHYRWGATLDPPLPGLMDRPYVSRELIPYGTPASAELIRALDRRLQEGVFEPSSLADIARLLGVGDVVMRNDLQYERFRTPRPRSTWYKLTNPVPAGLSAPQGFGPPVAETPVIPLTDEVTLGTPTNAADPPAMGVFGVQNPTPIVRAERADSPLVVAGDGEGLVDASAAGLLGGAGVIRYAGSMNPAQISASLGQSADLLVTDSNRKRAERWGTVRENYGYTERADEKPLEKDPTDARLPVFPNETTADQTVAEQRGVAGVEASDYGNPVAYAPADRPDNAFDGDVTSAWRVGAFADVRGQRIQVRLQHPVTTNSLTLVQPVTGPRNRYITGATVSFDGGKAVPITLGSSSRTSAGQKITFPTRTFSSVEFTIKATNVGVLKKWDGISGVGLAEMRIPGVPHLDEVLRLPTDVLTDAGAASLGHRLAIEVARDRADPQEPFKSDTEVDIARTFALPTARSFDISGTARVSAYADDLTVDRMLGRDVGPSVVRATSSTRLNGSLGDRASAAADGNPATAWSPAFGPQQGAWVQLSAPSPRTVSQLNLQLVADGRHSVPTRFTLEVDGKPLRDIKVPATKDGRAENGTVSAPVHFPAVTGKTFRLVVTGTRAEMTKDYFGGQPLALPVGIAEVGAPGLQVPALAGSQQLDTRCRSDLVTLDGRPVPVRLSGTVQDAEQRDGLPLSLCGPAPALSAGNHDLRSARGNVSGIDVDRLVLASAAGGGAGVATDPFTGPARTADAPAVQMQGDGPVSYRLQVTGAQPGKPFWLVLGQSDSPGWQAVAAGLGKLGPPQVVDGYANGWLVTPKTGSFDVALSWTPQRRVWAGLGVSAVLLLVVLGLAFGPRARRRAEIGARLTPDLDPEPVLESPFSGGARVPVLPAVVAGVAAGLLTAVLVRWWAGLLVAVLSVLAGLVPRTRIVLRTGAVGGLLVSALYVLEVQGRFHLPENGGWVAAFAKVATLSWLSVTFLVADTVVQYVQGRRGRDAQVGARAPAAPLDEPGPG